MAKLHRLMPGTRFANAFQVQRAIGEGAMGTVYLVTRVGDGKDVALKILKPSIAEDDRATARFAREGIVGARIGNEHVVDVLDAGFDEETGLHWLSMEYLDGHALPAYLEEHEPDAAVRRTLIRHLFDAIAAAHRAGVLHRDLKPENVVVTTDAAGGPLLKVLDFGVAKTLAPHMAASATEGGLGTPLWTAPEQGKGGDHIKPTADVWALGLLTFFILTGKIFWRNANEERASMLDIAQEMLQNAIPSPSLQAETMSLGGWPEELDAWFLRCVNRDVTARFPNADHARAALFPHFGFDAPPAMAVERSTPPPESSPPTSSPLAPSSPQPPPLSDASPQAPQSPASMLIVVALVAVVVFALGAAILFL